MSSSKSMEKEEWIELQYHPLFSNNKDMFANIEEDSNKNKSARLPMNLAAYDGTSRILLWNSSLSAIHLLDVRCPDSVCDTVTASSRVKTLRPSMKVDFVVRYIAVNRTGQLVVASSDENLIVLYLSERKFSSPDGGVCRATSIGSRAYFSKDNKGLRILQATWHPHSDTHIGVLSSDSVFRIFDLSSDLEVPEQEYHLQPATSHDTTAAVITRPIAFTFGGEHLWDRFAVFVLFSNGSVYTLCPIVPFGSVFNYAGIAEIYKDAMFSGNQSNSVDSKAGNNVGLAVAWLEAVFPELNDDDDSDDSIIEKNRSLGTKARPYAPFDASVVLQGPLPKMLSGGGNSCDADFKKLEGHAFRLLYSKASKDSILAIGFVEGQLEVYALADEVQPLWSFGSSPRLRLSEGGTLLSIAMVAEACLDMDSKDTLLSIGDKTGNDNDALSSSWIGDPPPMLRLSVVDFSLPSIVLDVGPFSLLGDPIIPERIYCYHGAGIDAVLLHWLPFSDMRNSVDKNPSVFPVLDTCPTPECFPVALFGVTTLLDSYGKAWVVAFTSGCECAVIEMKTQREVQPVLIEGTKEMQHTIEDPQTGTLEVMSREILLGPKDIPLPQMLSGKSLTTGTIEGRTLLHDHSKLLHEKYVEYAHKVYVELKEHTSRLTKFVEDQRQRMKELNVKLESIRKKDGHLKQRISNAILVNYKLEERLKEFSKFPGVTEKPLTPAEHDFNSLIDTWKYQDLEAMKSAVEVLNARFVRYLKLSQQNLKRTPQHTARSRNLTVPDSQMSRLKTAVGSLSKVVADSSCKVKLVEEAVRRREKLGD